MKPFTHFPDHSIARNLMLGLMLTLVVVAVLTMLVNAFLFSRQATRELEAKAEEYLTALTESLALPVWDYDESQVHLIGNAYARNELVAALEITDPDGTALFIFTRPGETSMISQTVRIMRLERHIGTISLSLSSSYYNRSNARFFWFYAITLLLMVLILAVVSTVLLRRLLQRPFDQFTEAVNAYTAGDQDAFTRQRIPYSELQPLIRVLHKMGQTLSSQVAELQQAEQRYHDIFDYAVVGIFQSTPDGRVIAANPALARIMGYTSPEELIHSVQNVQQQIYVHPEQREEFVNRMLLDSSISRFEVKQYRQDGSIIWVSVEARQVYDAQGTPAYYEGFLQDITSRKQMEEALQRSEKKYRGLYTSIRDGVAMVDMEGRFVEGNPALLDMLGYTFDEFTQLSNLDISPAEWHNTIENIITEQVSMRGYSDRFEIECIRKDGTVFPASIKGWTRKDEHDTPIGIWAVLRDITEPKQMLSELRRYRDQLEELVRERTAELEDEILERKQVEEALRRARNEAMEALRTSEESQREAEEARRAAETANQAKSIFLANMSHELRTPLNAVLGFAQFLGRDSTLTFAQRERLGIISRSGEHLLRLINDVLDMSKIEAGRMTLDIKSFDLRHMLANIGEMIRIRTEEKGLEFMVALGPTVPRYIRSDEGKLRQILLNLLGNAVKFTEKGRVELRVTHERCSQQKKQASAAHHARRILLQFSVVDTGIGIEAHECDKIFETFGRAALSRQTIEGTGLGLAISWKLAQLLEGQLLMNSPPPHPPEITPRPTHTGGPGSEFRFSLCVDETDTPTKSPARRVIELAPGQPESHILIVEDHKANRLLLRELLKSVGFHVHEAANGQEALDRLCKRHIDLIFMDMRMPVMDGYTTTQEIRHSRIKFQNVPIIALTASVFAEERKRILKAGCNDLICKPFQEHELLEMVRLHLGLEYRYEEQTQGNHTPSDNMSLRPDMLTALPSSILDALEQASMGLDMEALNQLIDEIRASHPAVATSLAKLVKELKCKPIWELVQKAKNL